MGSTNGSDEELMSRLVDSVKQISKFSNSKGFFGRIQGDLVRRITLLSPFFEELIDINAELNEEQQLTGFEVMRIALDSSLELFRSVNGGSKLLQIVHRGPVMQKFHDVTVEIEAALTQIPYDHFQVSEEVIEQVKLLHSQFKRATERQEDYDLQLSHDLAVAESVVDPDPETLKRLSQELQLSTIDELKKESHAIHEYFLSYEGDPDDCFQRMSSLLKKLVDCASTESSEPDTSTGSKVISRHRSPVIPEYFRCPISLELMKDPVIVSTGQTYERSSIQKWLDAGHKTCPKSQETLLHSGLTPNYVLKSLIALWCESNGIELPQNQGSSYRTTRPGGGSSSSDCDRAFVLALLEKLANGSTEQQRAAAGELRLLAKRNADNRVCIAEAGAIPLLVELLSSPDPRTQEHSVTALLNLSINEGNKGAIVDAGAITDIVEVLKNGSMEARENAAATLFSLSVVDENKVAIGAAGAIQALISLLEEGTRRGKKDAATAIFNLCIYQGNKSRAIKGGIVDPLTRLLKDAGGGAAEREREREKKAMSIIAGSYERFIWGFKLKPTKHDPDTHTLTLSPLFSYPSHLSSITTVACSGPAAASGGSDDTIHLYDLPSASSLGSLLDHNHTASITALSFYTPSSLSFPRNLISAAADGSVAIFDTDPFVLLKSFRPHKKAVNDLSIHPSGKLALAVYRDECFAMLNLVRGKRSFCCRLGHEASLVKFDPSGERFFMVVNSKVGVHQSEDAKLLLELDNGSRKPILCASPGDSGTLFTAGEDRAITAWDTNSGKLAYAIQDAHPARIKGVVTLTRNDSESASEDPYLVASASSDGIIRVWDMRMAAKENAKPLAETNTKSRLTCLAGSALKSMRRPQNGNQKAQQLEEGANSA